MYSGNLANGKGLTLAACVVNSDPKMLANKLGIHRSIDSAL
jgi:hypothetical protein